MHRFPSMIELRSMNKLSYNNENVTERHRSRDRH